MPVEEETSFVHSMTFIGKQKQLCTAGETRVDKPYIIFSESEIIISPRANIPGINGRTAYFSS